jgi:hypothetical protein
MTKEAEIKTLRKFMIPFDILTLTPEEHETSIITAHERNAEVVSVK